jgi:predicted alpha/beta superfamily hydrolase
MTMRIAIAAVSCALIFTLYAAPAFAQSGSAATENGAQKCTATGDLQIVELKSEIFRNTRKLRVLLPAGYRDPQNARRKYPVLYLNDGQNLFDVCTNIWAEAEWRVDETAAQLIAEKKVEPLIIVGVDNAGIHNEKRLEAEKTQGSRPNEYLPWPDAELEPPLPLVHGSLYPKFLTSEVMPFVEKTFRVKNGPENTGEGGSSYGGLIALYVARHTDHVFGRVLIESASIYVHDFTILKEIEGHKDWPERIYFGGGTGETFGTGTTETVAGDVDKAVRLLRADGVDSTRILVNITPGAHDEDAWATRFPAALIFLFPAKK